MSNRFCWKRRLHACCPIPPFNWLGFHLNGSHRDQASVCSNMTSFLQLIYSSSSSEFLKSSINANEKFASFFSTPLGVHFYNCEKKKLKKGSHNDTYFKFVLI